MKVRLWVIVLLGLAGITLELLGKSGIIAIVGLTFGLWNIISLLTGKIVLNDQNVFFLLLGIFLNGCAFLLMKEGVYIFLLLPWIVMGLLVWRLILNLAHYAATRITKSTPSRSHQNRWLLPETDDTEGKL